MLFAIFGLGIGEIIVLGLICVVPVAAAAIIVPVVLMASRRSRPKDQQRPEEKNDIGGEG